MKLSDHGSSLTAVTTGRHDGPTWRQTFRPWISDCSATDWVRSLGHQVKDLGRVKNSDPVATLLSNISLVPRWSEIFHLPLWIFTRSVRLWKYEKCEWFTMRTRLKFGERSFSCAGPRAWNGLPSSLQELTDTQNFQTQTKDLSFSAGP